MSDDRRPRDVYGLGDEPDPRFSLANERTCLAWMRTALAVVAGGAAIVSLSSVPTLPRWSALIGAAACLGGGVLALHSLQAWARVERALRLRRPLPAPRALATLAGGVVALAVLALALAVMQVVRR